MRKRFRKMTAVLLAAMIVTLMIPFGVTSVSATLSLQALRNKFPSGSYFNHPVNGTNNPDVVTYTPCPSDHDYVDTCTWFGGSSQCMGFAKKVTYDYYGSMFSEWAVLYDMNSLKAGDVIKYYPAGPQHFIWVTDISGDTITYVDCNGDFHCGIYWDNTTTKGTIYNKGFACVYSAPWAISGYTDTSAPTISNARVENVSGSSFTIKCDLYDDVGVTRVWLVIYGPNGEKQYGLSASNGTFSHTISTTDHGGAGVYRVHIYAFDATDNGTNYCEISNIYAGKRFTASNAVNLGEDFIAVITNVKSGKRISVNGNDNVIINSIDNTDSQKWHFTRYSDGSYKIANCQLGKCLDVSGARTEDETNIQVYQSNEGVAQKWYIIENSNGYGLVPLSCTSSTIDVAGGSIADGANVQQYQWNQSAAQNFTIDYVSLNPDNVIEYDGHRYEFYYNYTTWYQAYRTCEKLGGHLVTINSVDENQKMAELTHNYEGGAWIGATRESSNNWYWTNSESFDYTNWIEGQPDYYNQLETCAEIKTSGGAVGKWNDVPPDYSNQGFICEYDSIDNIEKYKPNKRICVDGLIYELYDYSVDWQTAKHICEIKGGQLVDISNEAEQNQVYSLVQSGNSSAYWIGLSDIDDEGNMKWVNGTNPSYVNWSDGEPNNTSGAEDYVAIFNSTGKWNDYPGYAKGYHTIGFICKYRKAECHLKADSTIEFKGHKYEFYRIDIAWLQAYRTCEKLGGHLVTINSDDENQKMAELTHNYEGGAWIGATRKSSDNWYWVNSESFDYTNWMEGQPDYYNQLETCAEIKTSGGAVGKWNDVPPDYFNQGFICEYDSIENIEKYKPNKSICVDGLIYELYDFSVDWQTAKYICEIKGGQLVDISDEAEQNRVYSLVQSGNSSAYWIGLSDIDDEGNMKWVNGTNPSYVNWSDGEPNNTSGAEDYVAIFNSTGKWNDYPGYAKGYHTIGFICKRKNTDFDLWTTVDNNESEVTIFHNSVFGAQQYMINIYDSKTNELVFSNDGLPDREIYIKLGNGDYYVNITTDNNLISDDVYFSIKKPLVGDANLDGSININDVTSIQRHIAELELLTEEKLAVSDTNGDGEISISDATYLQMYLAEYNVALGKQS